jgi:HSP90 family molecular chaperone
MSSSNKKCRFSSSSTTSTSSALRASLTSGVESNNQGVSLLLYGRHEDAVTALTRSLQLVQKVLRSPAAVATVGREEDEHEVEQEETLAAASSESTAGTLPFFSLRVGRPVSLKKKKKDTAEDEHEEDSESFRVFTNAIMIDPQPSSLETLDPSDASVIVMINLGLAYHLLVQSQMQQQQQQQQQHHLLYVSKVLPLYKVALDALQDNKAMGHKTNHLYTMALLNNMAGIFVTLKQKAMAQRYLQLLLQHVVFVRTTSVYRQQQPSSRRTTTEQAALEDFHVNTQGLILKESGMAPAA